MMALPSFRRGEKRATHNQPTASKRYFAVVAAAAGLFSLAAVCVVAVRGEEREREREERERERERESERERERERESRGHRPASSLSLPFPPSYFCNIFFARSEWTNNTADSSSSSRVPRMRILDPNPEAFCLHSK